MELEDEIRGIINDTIGGQYIGRMKVIQDDDGWMLSLGMDSDETPLQMYFMGSYEEFKKFVAKEFKQRHMQLVRFWGAVKEVPPTEERNGELVDVDENIVIM